MADQYPLIAGAMTSWAELRLSLGIYGGPSFKTIDFAAFDWDESLTPAKVKGIGPRMIGRTVGEHDANASMSMYLDSFTQFQKALAAAAASKGFSGIALVVFDVFAAWSPLDGPNPSAVHKVKAVGARIQSRGIKSAPGPDATIVEIPLNIVRVEVDGIALV